MEMLTPKPMLLNVHLQCCGSPDCKTHPISEEVVPVLQYRMLHFGIPSRDHPMGHADTSPAPWHYPHQKCYVLLLTHDSDEKGRLGLSPTLKACLCKTGAIRWPQLWLGRSVVLAVREHHPWLPGAGRSAAGKALLMLQTFDPAKNRQI